ncbi:MAG TPA: ATP-binding protein [bacterium]|jgi:anti-sigma regulatory factor (Ser/Thr protein kinase)|nr:ATP-binding protein [bacterium]
MWKLSVHLTTALPELRAVRHLVAFACRNEGGTDIESGLIEISFGEALANARLHAHASGTGQIMVDIAYDRPAMTVSVYNDGSPLLDRSAIPDARPEEESRGWGLYVIGRAMDEVEIQRSPHSDRGTLIRMTKNFALV